MDADDTPKIRLYKALTKDGPYDWAKEKAKLEPDNRIRILQERLDLIHEAARVDRPDEGKHELAVRIMQLARPSEAPLAMETYEGWKGND